MKKLLTFLVCCGLLAATLFSCDRQDADSARIRIEHQYVESGSIYPTRSIVPDADGALAAIMPETLYLTLLGDAGTFYGNTGTDIYLPFGHYEVEGTSKQTRTFVEGDAAWVSPEPLVVVDDVVDVVNGVDEYVVDAAIASFAIVWNNGYVDHVVFSTTLGTSGILPEIRYGNTSICCVTGSLAEAPLTVNLIPKEGQPWTARAFDLTTEPDGPGIYCETGKWYALRPFAIPPERGVIDFRCSLWTVGGEYY